MSKRLRPVLAAAFVLSASVAGCGQPGEEPPPATQGVATGTPTKQEFVERADAICLRMVEAGKAETAKPKRRPDAALERLIDRHDRLIRGLRTLEPPPDGKAQVGAVLLHLDRLQEAFRALETTKGMEILGPAAAIEIELDAVARAAKRYGLFRRCSAYRENPRIQQIMRKQEQAPEALPGPTRRTGPPPLTAEMRRLASALVPTGRSVSRRQDCPVDEPAMPTTCVTIELAPIDSPISARRAEIAGLAARNGWTQLKPTAGKGPIGLLALHREDVDGTVWLATPDCTPHLQAGDGPSPEAVASRCVDRIMVTTFR